MLNRSEILRSAWASYARDKHTGIIPRKGPFNRAHFGYCLRMAWSIAKERAAKAGAEIAERKALITEAGRLNNHPSLVNSDHVTFMALLGIEECRIHVACMRGYIADAERAPKVRQRIAALRAELNDQHLSDFIDWHRRDELKVELAGLLAT